MIRVTFGRNNGPSNDKEVTVDFEFSDVSIIKDVMAAVNKVSNDKEKWYIMIEDGNVTIPVFPGN